MKTFKCPNCAQDMRWDREFAGKIVTCSRCNKDVEQPWAAVAPLPVIVPVRPPVDAVHGNHLSALGDLRSGTVYGHERDTISKWVGGWSIAAFVGGIISLISCVGVGPAGLFAAICLFGQIPLARFVELLALAFFDIADAHVLAEDRVRGKGDRVGS